MSSFFYGEARCGTRKSFCLSCPIFSGNLAPTLSPRLRRCRGCCRVKNDASPPPQPWEGEKDRGVISERRSPSCSPPPPISPHLWERRKGNFKDSGEKETEEEKHLEIAFFPSVPPSLSLEIGSLKPCGSRKRGELLRASHTQQDISQKERKKIDVPYFAPCSFLPFAPSHQKLNNVYTRSSTA